MSHEPDLQFERAQFHNTPAAVLCATCAQPLVGCYYDVNGQTVCEACRYAIDARASASGIGRLFRSLGAGLVAAFLGALLYYAIAAFTGYEFGLIAIVVGYGVGSAVRWGSNARGGWKYQTLAIALTYLSIVATYVPPIIQGLREGWPDDAAVVAASEPDATGSAADSAIAQPVANSAAGTQPPVEVPSAALVGGAMLFILAIAIIAPFLGGLQNIMGLVIIGIGLYEAWKLNRRTEPSITGPHALASQSAGVNS